MPNAKNDATVDGQYSFTVYGDNIVEILRFRAAIIQSFSATGPVKISNEFDRLDLITQIQKQNVLYKFRFLAGFDCWYPSIISQLTSAGLKLRETPDILLAKNIDGKTIVPILALEYCSALQAGNQAWQRAGRGYAFGSINIPYIYLGVLGGTELDSTRGRKAARHPNPAIAQSFITFSMQTNGMFLPIYLPAPDFNLTAENKKFMPVLGEDLLSKTLKDLIFGNKISPETLKEINEKCLSYKDILLKGKRRKSSKGWTKKISIPISKITGKLHEYCKKNGKIIVSNDLPFCMLEGKSIVQGFYELIPAYYGRPVKYDRTSKIAVVFVAGFKPRGDDSRPDRGLLPFLRMLVGESTHIVSIVYGPMTNSMFAQFKKNPEKLPGQNGLFEALWLGNEICVSRPDGTGHIIFVNQKTAHSKQILKLKPPTEVTEKPSEHFVDQAICLLLDKSFKGRTIECMCNPPGGDWSGVSVFKSGKEFRWLSLPRVNGESKRPDHIYQIESPLGSDWLLIIESKDLPQKLEAKIGKRLTQYVSELISHTPSVERELNGVWVESKTRISMQNFRPITLFAFFDNDTKLNETHTDLLCKVSLQPKPILRFVACTKLGEQFLKDQLIQ